MFTILYTTAMTTYGIVRHSLYNKSRAKALQWTLTLSNLQRNRVISAVSFVFVVFGVVVVKESAAAANDDDDGDDDGSRAISETSGTISTFRRPKLRSFLAPTRAEDVDRSAVIVVVPESSATLLFVESLMFMRSAETATAASPSSSVPWPKVTTASVSPAPPLEGEAKDFGWCL